MKLEGLVREAGIIEVEGRRYQCNLHEIPMPGGYTGLRVYCHLVREGKPKATPKPLKPPKIPGVPENVVRQALRKAKEAQDDFFNKARPLVGRRINIGSDPSTASRRIYEAFKSIYLAHGAKLKGGEVSSVSPVDGVIIQVDVGGYTFFFQVGAFKIERNTILKAILVKTPVQIYQVVNEEGKVIYPVFERRRKR